MRERCVDAFDPHIYMSTNEMQLTIANQSPRQQTCFAQNLKPIADAQNQIAFRRKFFHGVHDRRKAGQRSGTQIIAIGKAARNDHGIVTAQLSIAVPDEIDRLAHVFRDHVIRVMVAVRSGKNYDTELHFSISTRKSSMIGLDNTSRARASACSRAFASLNEPSSATSKYFPWRMSAIPS